MRQTPWWGSKAWAPLPHRTTHLIALERRSTEATRTPVTSAESSTSTPTSEMELPRRSSPRNITALPTQANPRRSPNNADTLRTEREKVTSNVLT